ncbi:MAG: sigma-54 dependent transcriptional regulator [Alphaproteobacteria bacterium]|nr:sigma-54 dependent transcriptional regulator [Alphaproteobacteria bacterium]
MPRMLIIDDEPASCRTLALHFGERGFDVETAHSAEQGLAELDRTGADVVVSDIRMPGRDGLSLLAEIRQRFEATPVIMITAFHDLDTTVAAMHGGAVDYVTKPIDLDELEDAIDKALGAQAQAGNSGHEGGGLVVESGAAATELVGHSRPMQEAFKTIGMVSQSRVTVLLLGDSGTGKELVARAIHRASAEAAEPFVAVNCGALVETLLESEMFGHQRGAFTGAVATRRGKVALAGDGTLFLDEIGELSPGMQGKLLRLLEAREFSPVGSTKTLISNARFIAATNADLETRVTDGSFREDLFYRLNVVTIALPALRQRREDVPALAAHLLRRINRDIHRGIRHVSAEAMEALVAAPWPGNVRQLENVLTKAVVMAQGEVLALSDLPAELNHEGEVEPAPADDGLSLREVERRHIGQVLEATGWHKGRACQILGISRPRLDRRIKEYALRR